MSSKNNHIHASIQNLCDCWNSLNEFLQFDPSDTLKKADDDMDDIMYGLQEALVAELNNVY